MYIKSRNSQPVFYYIIKRYECNKKITIAQRDLAARYVRRGGRRRLLHEMKSPGRIVPGATSDSFRLSIGASDAARMGFVMQEAAERV